MVADRSVAEELTQDVFVRAWAKLAIVPRRERVRHLAAPAGGQRRAQRSKERRTEPLAVWLRARRGRYRSPHARASGWSPGWRCDLEAAIAGLPPGARQVFVLHDVEGYKHEEIAEMLGITSGGSKAQLHRARLLLREALNR